MEGATDGGGIQVVSRRMVRPLTPPPAANGMNGCHLPEEVEVIHLTPWDLRLITVDYIQKGILLPKPPVSGDVLVNALVSSFSRALVLFYPFAGRLASEEHGDGTVSVFLRCTGEGAEFVHAAAPGVAVGDIVGPLYTPSVVSELYPKDTQVRCADAALKPIPLLSAQVTELADGVFIGISLNHAVGDGSTFWHFLNTWSESNRRGDILSNLYTRSNSNLVSIPIQGGSATGGDFLVYPPCLGARWFAGATPVPIRVPCFKLSYLLELKNELEDINKTVKGRPACTANVFGLLRVQALAANLWRKLKGVILWRRFWFVQREASPVAECFFPFSAASVKKLKAQANAEIAVTAAATAAISSLQAVLAHFWRAVCRARRLPPEQVTFYSVVIGCRGRVNGIPPGYVGNAMVFGKAEATVGEIEEKGLGWTAWLLNRAVASFDEASMRESMELWVREPDFTYMGNLSSAGTALVTGSSPRFNVFGNDFGWGKPLAVRSGPGNKVDGKATVFEGPEEGGSMSLEVCIAPDALRRLVADKEFMGAVSLPA